MKSAHGYSKAIGVLLGGDGVEVAAQEAARYGLDQVLFHRSGSFEPYLAQVHADAIKRILQTYDATAVLGLASSRGKDLFPRIAQLLDAGQASDCIAILDGGRFKRPMYAGNILAEVEITSPKKVVTVRGSAFAPATAQGQSTVEEISGDVSNAGQMTFVNFDTVKSERPELTEAEVVVSGGRAMKSAENFTNIILPLADAFGGAVGASRAAVDSGYAPNDWQVGQTGKVVAPKLYIAVGISGAIQHLAGMKDSKTIVAINKDPEAPIFEVADYGLVADLFEVVPQLTTLVKQAKASS